MTSWGVSDHISWFEIISRWKIFYIYSLISPIYRESVRDQKFDRGKPLNYRYICKDDSIWKQRCWTRTRTRIFSYFPTDTNIIKTKGTVILSCTARTVRARRTIMHLSYLVDRVHEPFKNIPVWNVVDKVVWEVSNVSKMFPKIIFSLFRFWIDKT